MALKQNGEAPFPMAGKGVFLCFNLADIAKLEEQYGVGEYLQTIETNLKQGSGGTLLKCLEVGLKTRDENDRRVLVKLNLEELDFSAIDAFEPIMDALCLAVSNQTYADMLLEIEARQQELEEMLTAQAEETKDEGPLPDSGVQSDTRPSDTEPD